MSDLSPETNELLALARSADGLTDERRSRIKAGLLAQVAVISVIGATSATAGAGATIASGASGAAGAGAGATAGKLAWLSSSLFKAISALALLTASGAGVYVVAHHQAAPVAATAPAQAVKVAPAAAEPAPTLAELTPTEPASELAASPELPASKSSPVGARAASASITPETLSEETRLLRDADQALRAGNAQRALTLLGEHASRYPRGALAPERNAERMIARCKLGQVDAKAAQGYLASHANSAFAPRIRDACGVN